MVTATTGVGGTTALGAASAAAGKVSTDDFLRLLVTQLQNQNPLDPMTNEQFLTQLAQFQALDEMISTSSNTAAMLLGAKLSLAGGLIGRTVTAELSGGGTVTGVVERVVVEDGEPLLVIGSDRLTVDAVKEIF